MVEQHEGGPSNMLYEHFDFFFFFFIQEHEHASSKKLCANISFPNKLKFEMHKNSKQYKYLCNSQNIYNRAWNTTYSFIP